MSDWFSSLANQAIQLADSFADSLVSQATEAQQQIESEQKKLQEEENLKNVKLQSFDRLPWESDDETLAILSQELMEQILGLSVNEENFLITPLNSSEVYFNFKDFIPTAMNLLKIDSNLARMHSKLSPKMDEETFWFNYHCRISYLRTYIGLDGAEAKMKCRYELNEVVFNPVKRTEEVNKQFVTTNDSAVSEYKLPPIVFESEEQRLTAQVDAALRHTENEVDEYVLEECSDDDLDLGDLDDLLDLEDAEAAASATTGSESYDKLGKSDCNDEDDDELEAQIARELSK